LTGCVATQAGAFCFLHVADGADAAITSVSASLSDAPEGSVSCHSGYDAGRAIVTGLNSSFNHAQLASAYYIGRHISLSVLGYFFHSNTDGDCLRLSFGSQSDESIQEAIVTCVSLVNNSCRKILSGIEGRGLV
jgi:DNA-binding transcriptional MocR family regulator